MANFDQVRTVMARLGGLLECQNITEYEQRESWIVVVDDLTVLEIAFDDRIDLLHVTSPIGSMPQARRQAFCELLLRYGDQWSSTGGLRIGLAADSDHLSLTASFPAERIEPTVFARQLQNFASTAADWRQLILSWPDKASEEETAATSTAAAAFEYVIRA